MSEQNEANVEENEVNSTETQPKQQKTSTSQKIANLAKMVKKMGAKQTLLLPLVKILVIVFLVILALIIITGIFMFLVTMPGMVMDKLSALFREAGKYLAAVFGADTTTQIDRKEMYETMDYIEQMGWDLKGDGILTKYYDDASDITGQVKSDLKEAYDLEEDGFSVDEKIGVVRGSNNEIILADSDFIFTYIMSDNYIYTIKNKNLVTQQNYFDGILGVLESYYTGLITIAYKLLNTAYGPLFDLFGVTDAAIDAFGKGMLVFYYEDGELGKIGNAVNENTILSRADIAVNVEANTLSIKRNGIFNHNYPIEYSLDGWTGRYGMPLEFLLSIHKATMKPDLAYDMATSFATNVNIALHDITGEIQSGYKIEDGIVSYKQIERATATYPNSTNIWEDLVNWLDMNLSTNRDEIEAMYYLGIDIIDDCPDCETRTLYIIYDESSPDYGEMLVRVEGGEIKEDDGEGDFRNADFYYSLDDDDYKGGWWNSFLGRTDDDSKGNGEKAIGDKNDNGTMDYYTDIPEPGYREKVCTYCYCIIGEDDEICSGCGKYAETPADSTEATIEYCDCDEDEELASFVKAEPWVKYTGDKNDINRYVTVIDICDACEDKAKNILYYLRDKSDYNFKAYQPYIFSVTDHWYRDLYFIDPNYAKVDDPDKINFVDQDYDYEALMKDRWTLYETYDDDDFASENDENYEKLYGQFKLYLVDKEGNFFTETSKVEENRANTENVEPVDMEKVKAGTDGYLYYEVASVDEAEEVGLAVIKKAITFDINDTDMLSDLGWNETNGIWTAYRQLETTTQTGFKPISSLYETYSDYTGTYSDQRQSGTQITDRIYINMATEKNIEQTGEGLRTETNPQIKEMFLQNKYFQYDGSYETAEVITALREKIYEERKNSSIVDKFTNLTNKYGPLTEDEFKASYKLDVDGDGNNDDLNGDGTADDFEVKNYAGTVNLKQDALNAFTMLENIHTLDADYIYRDFKELIVELDVYDKEQLTEGEDIPRILTFVIPDIGSAGYPDRTIDKIDNEFGTMVHSKYDIEANKKYTLREVMANEDIGDYNGEPGNAEGPGDQAKVEKQEERLLASRVNNNRLSLSVKEIETQGVGRLREADELKKPSQIPIRKWFEETREMCEYINMVGYDYCVYSEPGDDDSKRGACTCDIHCKEIYAQIGVCYKQLNDPVHHCDCPANHCKHDIHGNPHFLSATFEGSKADKCNNVCCNYLVRWALQNIGLGTASEDEMTILNRLVAEDEAELISKGDTIEEGDIIYSGTHIEIVGEESGNGFVQYNGGHQVKIGAVERGEKSAIGFVTEADCWDWATGGYRLKWAKESEPDVYEGYEGNEAVVSPVTGVLLEYGTTIRVNLDQKHKSPYEDKVDEANGETIESQDMSTSTVTDDVGVTNPEAITGEIVEEEVGYAKILVLNEEYYNAYEKKLSGSHSLNLEPVNTLKELDDLDYLSETVQAYRDYKDLYEYHNIAGYIVTVEGFKMELPDEDFDSNGDEHFDDETSLPDGEDLTMSDFEVDVSNIKDPEKLETRYEIPKEYTMASEKATEKLEVEQTMRFDAALAMKVGDYVFIKEGTVLGRTYTDREVILTLRENEELTDYMSEETLNGQDPDPEEGNLDKVIGNYVRVIMENGNQEDKDNTYVEDVEDYMKLDELEPAEPNDWELFFWAPFESGACDDPVNGGPECIGVCSVGETAIGLIQWTAQESNGGNNIAGFCKAALEKDSRLCAPLSAFVNWTPTQIADDIGRTPGTYNADSQIKAALDQICNDNREAFLAIQMEIAKEQYLEPLLETMPWLEARRSCVQGIVMHLAVWGAPRRVEIESMENATDEEIILKCREIISQTGSTVGPASNDPNSGRAFNEPEIALKIVAGELSEDEIEEWVRTKDWSIVGFDPR